MKTPSHLRPIFAAFTIIALNVGCPLSGAETNYVEGGPLHLTLKENFPPVPLRGYGTLSGSLLFSSNAKPVSLLEITCENENKASILRAKYLSDLGLLSGVTSVQVPTKHGSVTARQVEGQGLVAAVQSGAHVFVLAARDNQGIASLVEDNLSPSLKIDVTESQAKVPMYLDRWDRYGMRFYYSTFTTPKGMDRLSSPYDPMDDFNFAHDEGGCGLVFWQNPFPLESAEGIQKTHMWDWALGQAQKTGLPVGINTYNGTPCSLFNRYREQWTVHQPQFLGGYYGLLNPAEDIFSWNSVEGREVQLTQVQQTIRQFGNVDNIVNWLNPDGEMGHGASDNLIDFGPTADTGYREFLKSKYTTVDAVATRWFGNANVLHSWDDVHVPELASFLGYGKDAIDLTGTWRVSHDATAGPETAAPAFDDSHWPQMTAPGHAIAILLTPFKPAVLRRHVTIPPAWKSAHEHVWLYVFDLSDTRKTDSPTRAFLNGTELTEAQPAEPKAQGHWAAYDVSSILTAGDNTVAVDVPQGFFNYRVYLSPEAPHSYPDLGPQLNAQWADFIDWGSWSRANAVRRGAQAIRQADPNRPITSMSPDTYAADIKTVCEDYGCVFHNTGYMAGGWADAHPMEMECSNLPTDLEPGSGARDVPDLKGYLGRWSTEGIQGIDYFQHIGDIEWNPEMKSYFHDTINLWHLIGKYHVPKAEVAVLSSDRVIRLFGFPFHRDPKTSAPHGHWDVGVASALLPEFPREEVFEQDFDRGNADAYKVIIDLGTSVMDDTFVAKIDKWVRNGGIFITWGQTGRHTSTDMDAWPISKLTGYKVTALNGPGRKLHLADGQSFLGTTPFDATRNFSGMTLEKQTAECSDLVQWSDGSAAIGLRPLGKGFVITTGPNLGGADALGLLTDILDKAKIAHVPATAPNLLMRHFVSNNGLYDIWAMWNNSKSPITTTLTFRNGLHPTSALDVKTGKAITVQDGAIPITLDTYETQVLLTPRDEIASAPADWFKLQRNWWRGTGDLGAPLPPYPSKFTLDLQADWKFKVLDGADGSQGKALSETALDDSSWEQRPVGIFTFPDHHDAKHAVFRKHFTVPAHWNSGKILFWLGDWHATGFIDRGQSYLDGEPLSEHSIMGDDLTALLKPGTSHVLTLDIWGKTPLVGTAASVWLSFQPDSVQEQDLSGAWNPAVDGLTYTDPVTIPGAYTGITLRQIVKVDAAHAGQTAVIRVGAADNSIHGVIVNGVWVPRFHHHLGTAFDLAITPYLKFGEDNEILLYGPGPHTLKKVALEYYAKGTYP